MKRTESRSSSSIAWSRARDALTRAQQAVHSASSKSVALDEVAVVDILTTASDIHKIEQTIVGVVCKSTV